MMRVEPLRGISSPAQWGLMLFRFALGCFKVFASGRAEIDAELPLGQFRYFWALNQKLDFRD